MRCDESPGQCQNCRAAGWNCEGYDLGRLPKGRTRSETVSVKAQPRPALAMTSDEQRSFSYFQHHSIVNLTALWVSPLWQQHVLQMCHADQAVFHAVNMLSAAHQASELRNMRALEGLSQSHRVCQFSLQQSVHAISLLNQRLSSNDPEVRQIVLLCCLLFVLSDVFLGRYESARGHLRYGLRIIKEMERTEIVSRVEPSLVAAFRRFDLQTDIYLTGRQVFCSNHPPLIHDGPVEPYSTFSPAQPALAELLGSGIAYITTCLSLSDIDFLADYASLSLEHARSSSQLSQATQQFKVFCQQRLPTLNAQGTRSLDLLRLFLMSQALCLKITMSIEPLPDYLLPETLIVLEAHEAFIARYPDLPMFTADHGVITTMYVLATRAPTLNAGLRAVNVLRAWPHYEGLLNSSLVAAVAVRALREQFGASEVEIVMSEEEILFLRQS
ncbi:uncharacterized protein DSM5745_06055 [Aspergillus mulundensis]|uniref:Zn(2)-C6 fungal-type domain-containing protein n=1 Tax=Aspergillus mulundensis TaxID=1810919 RepID=A0A3D8RYS3_9EURO|nr:hypothetical protein DSM5745_06055 [Aspergillus mulundensis]RDW79203.1 hypothetical protein DSM5745_06055 [Aspergillus mulundensis]